tara:strand:- start:1018 stop:1644 length:627 start_codon:yes stop_codon:yes gene_type:complete
MDKFNKVNVIDFSFKPNEYLNDIKFLGSNNLKNKLKFKFIKGQNVDSTHFTDVLDIMNPYLKDNDLLSLFFGIEDFIGFSNKDSVPDKEKVLGRQAFVILSESSTIFYLSSPKSKKLLESLKPFYTVLDKERDFSWLELIKKEVKIDGLFLPKDLSFSSIELGWIKRNYKSVLIDRKFWPNITALENKKFEITEFDSGETKNTYLKLV